MFASEHKISLRMFNFESKMHLILIKKKNKYSQILEKLNFVCTGIIMLNVIKPVRTKPNFLLQFIANICKKYVPYSVAHFQL